MTPARKAALLRLLEDHDAGKPHTEAWKLNRQTQKGLSNAGFVTSGFGESFMRTLKLTPAGLSAARAIREPGHE